MWFNVVSGFVSFLAFIRFLNINLAILNLLPIPILDGGHIIFALWRGIFGRELPKKVITILCNGFAMLLIAFFIFVSCKDVINVKDVFFSNKESTEEQAQPDPVEEPVEAVEEGK
jgi:regulator of sigma E protease